MYLAKSSRYYLTKRIYFNFISDFIASGRNGNENCLPDHPKAMNHFRRRRQQFNNDAMSVCSSHKSSGSRQVICDCQVLILKSMNNFGDLSSVKTKKVSTYYHVISFSGCRWLHTQMRHVLYAVAHTISHLEIEQDENL